MVGIVEIPAVVSVRMCDSMERCRRVSVHCYHHVAAEMSAEDADNSGCKYCTAQLTAELSGQIDCTVPALEQPDQDLVVAFHDLEWTGKL